MSIVSRCHCDCTHTALLSKVEIVTFRYIGPCFWGTSPYNVATLIYLLVNTIIVGLTISVGRGCRTPEWEALARHLHDLVLVGVSLFFLYICCVGSARCPMMLSCRLSLLVYDQAEVPLYRSPGSTQERRFSELSPEEQVSLPPVHGQSPAHLCGRSVFLRMCLHGDPHP